MSKTFKRKMKGNELGFREFTGRDGVRYLVFRSINGSFHVFAEVDAKQAARDVLAARGCGPEEAANGTTRSMWGSLWEEGGGSRSVHSPVEGGEKSLSAQTLRELPPDPEEYGLRYKKFWQGLLDRAKAKTSLHANVTPGKYDWIGAGSGIGGLGFNYAIRKDRATAELYIDRGKGKAAENNGIFDKLHSLKGEIEKAFGGELSWERLDDKRACRIACKITTGGWGSDGAQWPTIQDDMIDAMVRLEKALRPVLAKLKVEG